MESVRGTSESEAEGEGSGPTQEPLEVELG